MKKISKTIITLGLLGSFLFSASTANAALTQSQIDAVIGLLQAFGAEAKVINDVRASLGGQAPAPQSATFCYNWTRNLRVGDKGADVDALGKVLQKEGLNIPGYAYSGIDDSLTYNVFVVTAVTGFQEKYASEILKPNLLSRGTGYVGAATRAKLNALYGCSKPATPTACSNGATNYPRCNANLLFNPSITVLSPNGGETFRSDDTISISFKTILQEGPFNLYLKNGREDMAYMSIDSYISGSNIVAFRPSARLLAGGTLVLGTNYRITVCNRNADVTKIKGFSPTIF